MEADIRTVHVERYYPDVLANAKEFKAIAAAENPEFKKVWKVIWKQFLNTFVYSLDEDGATRWESMLKLYPASTDTLDTRRKRILSKINSSLPYTERSLQNMLAGIYGAGNIEVSIAYNKYIVWLDTMAALLLKSARIRIFARAIVPANMTIGIRNTKNARLSLAIEVVMRQTKHSTIHPAISFEVGKSTGGVFIAGLVKKGVHIILRS